MYYDVTELEWWYEIRKPHSVDHHLETYLPRGDLLKRRGNFHKVTMSGKYDVKDILFYYARLPSAIATWRVPYECRRILERQSGFLHVRKAKKNCSLEYVLNFLKGIGYEVCDGQ